LGTALVVGAALANLGPDAPHESFRAYMATNAPDVPVFCRTPETGVIRAAALDWQGVIGLGADLIAYGGALWGAYMHFVKPRLRKNRGVSEPFIFVSIRGPDRMFVQFRVGPDYANRDAFVQAFVAQVEDLRFGQGASDEELLSEFAGERWIRIQVGEEEDQLVPPISGS
jgi:hypothetical protein